MPAAEAATTGARCAGERLRHDRREPADPVDAGLVEHVAAGEPGTAERGRRVVVATDDVVERRPRVGLGLLPAVAVDDHLDRQRARLLLIAMSSSAPTVSYWWMAQSNPPAPALRSTAAFCAMMSSPPSAS